MRRHLAATSDWTSSPEAASPSSSKGIHATAWRPARGNQYCYDGYVRHPESGSWSGRVLAALEAGDSIGREAAMEIAPGALYARLSAERLPEIPASEIRQALTSSGLRADPRGIAFLGARITGALDLSSVDKLPPLRFVGCDFEAPPILSHSSIAALAIERCAIPGLWAAGIEVHADLRLAGIEARGTVDLAGCQIGRRMNMSGAWLDHPEGVALSIDRASVGGVAALHDMSVHGEVNAVGLQTGGELDLTHAQILAGEEGGPRTVLRLGGAEIGGNLKLTGLVTLGEVRAPGIRVSGQVDASEARLHGREGRALQLNRARIEGSFFLERAQVDGDVRVIGARIGGQLFLDESRLTSHGGFALLMGGTDVAGNVYLTRARFVGQWSARGAVIRGRVRARDSVFEASGKRALELDRMIVEGDAELSGVIVMGDASIAAAFRKSLDLTNGNFATLSFAEAEIRRLVLDATTATRIDFSGADIGHLVAGARPLPPISTAQGWRVGVLEGRRRTGTTETDAEVLDGSTPPLTRDEVTEWLDQSQGSFESDSHGFSQQPWKAIAQAFADLGQPEDARRLRFRASRRATRAASPMARLPRLLYGATVGYGYYPGLVLFWLAGLYGVALVAASTAAFKPTRPNETADNDRVIPWLLAVDTALPAAATGEAAAWTVTDPAWALLFGSIRVAGWVLISLLIAGVTGIIRKD